MNLSAAHGREVHNVEYLRAFLLGRVGWTALNGLLIISGAFGMFRKDIVIAVGGFDLHCIGEDAELVARMHRHMHKRKIPYRMVMVPDRVNWTEVPETTKVLGRQRQRWSRGLTELIIKHRSMLFNPRYGRIGWVVLPYFLVFEALGPIIELLEFVTVLAGLLARAAGNSWLRERFGNCRSCRRFANCR